MGSEASYIKSTSDGFESGSTLSSCPSFNRSSCTCSNAKLHCYRKQSKGIYAVFLGFKHYVIEFHCTCKSCGRNVIITVEKDRSSPPAIFRRGNYSSFLYLEWDSSMNDNMADLMQKIERVYVGNYDPLNENCQHYANRVWYATP